MTHDLDHSERWRRTTIRPLGLGLALLTIYALMISASARADEVAMPDPTMTPGAIDPTVTLSRICNETTRHRRPPSTKLCDAVFAAYSIPPDHRYRYECDHDVPVALGGSTVAANLWPQPNAEAERKDRLEVEMQRRACVAFRTLVPAEAAAVLLQEQREIAEDWVAAYRRYIGPLQALR